MSTEELNDRVASCEDRVAAIEGRVSMVEHRMGTVESRQSRTEKLLLEIQGEVRAAQKTILAKLEEMKELLSLGLGKTVVKAVTQLTNIAQPAGDAFSLAVDKLDEG